jgi:hypothetical protein
MDTSPSKRRCRRVKNLYRDYAKETRKGARTPLSLKEWARGQRGIEPKRNYLADIDQWFAAKRSAS